MSTSRVVLASLLIAGRTRWPLRLALAVSLPMLISRWLSLLGDFPALDIGMPVIHAAFLALTVFLIVRQIFAERSVGLDQVLAGINAYLLLGVAFSQLHIAVEAAAPGAYQLGDTALSQVAAGTGGISQIFMYFSFTTLTTLGYGDIRPVGEFARILCTSEALVGQLFVAVLIARLVSDYARRPREAA